MKWIFLIPATIVAFIIAILWYIVILLWEMNYRIAGNQFDWMDSKVTEVLGFLFMQDVRDPPESYTIPRKSIKRKL